MNSVSNVSEADKLDKAKMFTTYERMTQAVHYTLKGYDKHAICLVSVTSNGKKVYATGEAEVEYGKTADATELQVNAESDGYAKALAKLYDENNEDYEFVGND